MTQTDYVIQDLKNQISRLSEERALYFAIASENEQKKTELQQEIEKLKQQNEKGADEQ